MEVFYALYIIFHSFIFAIPVHSTSFSPNPLQRQGEVYDGSESDSCLWRNEFVCPS